MSQLTKGHITLHDAVDLFLAARIKNTDLAFKYPPTIGSVYDWMEAGDPLYTKCPCGELVEVTRDDEGDYDVCFITCPKCHRRSTGGNGRTGYIGSWATETEVDEANEIYQAQLMDVDYHQAMQDW